MEQHEQLAFSNLRRPVKIAIIGAESTGKSTLVQALFQQLRRTEVQNIVVLPELLRQFCLNRGRTPSAQEQSGLMQEQIEAEARATESAGIVLCDSPPLATAIYSDLHFGDHSLYPLALAHQGSYHLSLLTWPDFPWQQDPHPGMRDGVKAQETFHRRLIERMLQDKLPHLALHGNEVERTNHALAAILALIR